MLSKFPFSQRQFSLFSTSKLLTDTFARKQLHNTYNFVVAYRPVATTSTVLRFNVFYVFQNPKNVTFYVFAVFHEFSRTMQVRSPGEFCVRTILLNFGGICIKMDVIS